MPPYFGSLIKIIIKIRLPSVVTMVRLFSLKLSCQEMLNFTRVPKKERNKNNLIFQIVNSVHEINVTLMK